MTAPVTLELERLHGGPDALGVPLHDFSTNSNACGPCPQAVAALQACDASHYPDPHYTVLRQQLADFHCVDPSRIVLAGSEGAAALRIDGRHAHEEAMVREGVARAGLPPEVYDIIKALKGTDCVNFYACSLAASIFGVNEGNLIPEAQGIVGAAWFLNEKAAKADHCQYF